MIKQSYLFVGNSFVSQQTANTRPKASMDVSGERISGSQHPPSRSSPDYRSDAAWSSEHDDVELEKSNILMLGPTGNHPHICCCHAACDHQCCLQLMLWRESHIKQ